MKYEHGPSFFIKPSPLEMAVFALVILSLGGNPLNHVLRLNARS
jgi:hypothetical protein